MQFDAAPLLPLMEELFVQGALALHAAAGCDNEAAKELIVSIDELNRVSLEHHDRVEESLWIERLQRLADADDRNPLLSGYACATLLERGLLANDALIREVSRPPVAGASPPTSARRAGSRGWRGSNRSCVACPPAKPLWEAARAAVGLARCRAILKRAPGVSYTRRAFTGFSPREKRNVCENLGEVWAVHPRRGQRSA